MAHLNPKPEDVASKVPELRKAFAEKFAENIKTSLYDPRDLERLEKDDAYARLFLRTLKSKGSVEKSIDLIHESFKFRKEQGINDLTESSFPAEITEKNGIYFKGHDMENHPVLYIDVKQNTATAEQTPMMKRYIAWHFERHQKATPEQMCVVLMDMSGAGTGNMSMDMTKYIISCFSTYFPTFLAYMINYELPFLLSATWSIISTFLSSEQNQKMLMVKKKDIKKYIPEEHLWPHMR